MKSSQTTLRGYHALLGDGAIFECLLQLDERYNALGALAAVQADRECGALSARLNRIMYDTKQALQASRSPFNGQKYLAEVMAAFTPGVNMCNPRRRAMIERARDDLLQSIARYDDLWESALTEERLEAMVAALLAGGFGQPQTHPIHYRDTGDVGLAIVASRG